MASTLSFQGITSGLQTDSLIDAIIQQDGQPLQRLKDRQTLNTNRAAALKSMRTSMLSLSVGVASLSDALAAKTVSSTDANQSFVSATATGATNGTYQVKVASIATKGQVSIGVADPNAAILSSSSGSFAVQGTDGTVKAFTLTNNNLNGLRDAINASGAGVTATIVNTGSGATPYQLIVTANDTGTGTTGGTVRLAAIDNADGTPTTVDSSIAGLDGGALTGTFAAPTGLSGGLQSSGAGVAQDAVFSVNGVQMTRKTNVVKDAVDGVTFTLKKGDTTNDTTLTIAQDTGAATTALQSLISQYNSLLKTYKDASTPVNDGSGTITHQPLEGDSVARNMMSQLRSALTGGASGLPSSATYKSGANVGIKTNADGTLSLDATTFKNALENDPKAVARVFGMSGTSTAGGVQFSSGTSATATGDIGFNLTYGAGGAVSGSLTYQGTTYSGLTGTNGTLQGLAGTPLEGLVLGVTASGSGTLTVSRGIGQQLQDAISSLTSYSGVLQQTQASIDSQNKALTSRIDQQQALLDKRKTTLKAQFDAMESTLAQLRTASSGLTGLS
ncbi:flagellar filament capping protein FliD [Geothrix sp. 21YS21S-4]|uniref:flagellar filament capping protein FliD n=1 Tax=Geothrix sp. 21YS21S-4 TaxID=3068889 RepID=UPI0027B8FCDB|nr:flagellar filament capping protein FliD [Geothrix sp. 21YS21S-4]